MFMIWGTRIVRRPLGRRADYCHLCRAVRPMTRLKVETVGHLNYLSVGPRTPMGLREKCETCGAEFVVEADAPLVRSRFMDVEALIEATNPDVEARHAAELGLAERLRTRRAGADEKAKAIQDALVCADVLMSERAAGFTVDALAAVSLVLMILVPALVMVRVEGMDKPEARETGELVAALAGVVFLASAFFCVSTDARRYFRRKVRPALARALGPLEPTVEDLERAFASMGGNGHDVLARFTDPATLHDKAFTSR